MHKLAPLVLLLLVPLSSDTLGQQHAPTEAQCSADARAWTKDQTTPPMAELVLRNKEMGTCGDSYGTHDLYTAVVLGNLTELTSRTFHFVDRHGLSAQFGKEDNDGQR